MSFALRDVTNCNANSKRSVPEVEPISPAAVTSELHQIDSRLLQLIQGMAAWTAQRQSAEANGKCSAAIQKLGESQNLLRQCQTLQALQSSVKTQAVNANGVSQASPSAASLPARPAMDAALFAAPKGSRPATAAAADKRSPNSVSAPVPQRVTSQSAGWPPKQSCYIIVVEFKRQRMRRCESDSPIEPGNFVILPGDRGFDCGLVIQCAAWQGETRSMDADTLMCMDSNPIDISRLKGPLIPVYREATSEEVQHLYEEQARKERVALKACRDLVLRLKLEMEVVDCEYQFDGTKISFYFEADHSIDFRGLTKELYRLFNARIWLENVNSTVKNVVPEHATARNGNLFA